MKYLKITLLALLTAALFYSCQEKKEIIKIETKIIEAPKPVMAAWQSVESSLSVKETMDNLEKIVKSKGLTVFARINHSAGAEKVAMELRPTELLIFGNPKMGTLLMQSNQEIGIDLPLKYLVYQNEAEKTIIKYLDGSALASRHSVTDKEMIIKKIDGALGKMANAASQKK